MQFIYNIQSSLLNYHLQAIKTCILAQYLQIYNHCTVSEEQVFKQIIPPIKLLPIFQEMVNQVPQILPLYIDYNNITLPRMRSILTNLAQEIVRGGPRGLEANQQFRTLINQLTNLDECLLAADESDNMLFVYCTNMIKLIENSEFCIISETRSEENIVNMVDGCSQKSKTYGHILMSLARSLLARPNRHGYLVKSMLDLMSLCLKVLFEDNNNISFLQTFISYFLPAYRVDQSFCTATETPLILLTPRYELDLGNPSNFLFLLQTFSSMLEYITVQNGTKTYYQYRRSIYVFRNSYLAHFLQFGVEFTKLLFLRFNSNSSLRPLLAHGICFLEHVFMYPFTLSLHEFQIDDDLGQNIAGLNSGDIYFSNYFRHVLCDIDYLGDLLRYYNLVLGSSTNFDDCRQQIYSLVKILGRVAVPSQYTFKNEQQRKSSRMFSLSVLQVLCAPPRFMDSYMLHSIMDVIQKILLMSDSLLADKKYQIIGIVLNFLHNVMSFSQINVEEGKRSPFARVFEILGVCLDFTKDKLDEGQGRQVKQSCQQILEKAYSRIISPEAVKILQKFGHNQPTQIECFSELFEHIIPVFEANLETNLAIFQKLEESALSQQAAIIWLHLCSQLLPKTQANFNQTKIILKYYRLASLNNNLASLRYIKTLVQQVLSECNEGSSSTALWRNIQQLQGTSFHDFILAAIYLCLNNFKCRNSEIIDFSLEFFKGIYFNLRKNDDKSFLAFYSVVGQLLNSIDNTVFASPQFFHKRRAFFNVISLIWVNADTIAYIYEIYNIVASKITTPSLDKFYQYLHDITGILQPVQKHEAFQVIAELAMNDLERLFALHLGNKNSAQAFFSDAYYLKIFCKLGLAFLTDLTRKLYYETHTDIPYKIHRLFNQYLLKIVEGDYELPKCFTTILVKMIPLNPLSMLVPLNKVIPALKSQSPEQSQKLVRSYFDNIQRVQDIDWMYGLIQENIDFMVSWWEEAMNRQMHPKIELKTIVEARIWTTNRHKQTLAKLVFQVGTYDPVYWNVSSFQSERDFVTQFNLIYT